MNQNLMHQNFDKQVWKIKQSICKMTEHTNCVNKTLALISKQSSVTLGIMTTTSLRSRLNLMFCTLAYRCLKKKIPDIAI